MTHDQGVNQRLDFFLAKKIRDISRSQIQRLVEEGSVRVNGQTTKSSYKLKPGDRIHIEYKPQKSEKTEPEKIPLHILYKDKDILIIEKPSGLVVHPGAGVRGGTLVNALLYHFPEVKGVGPEERAGIVHRLDKDTSGVMVVARTTKAYRHLQQQFKEKKVEKLYLGLAWGKMPQKSGKITWPIGRHPKHGERISIKTRKPRRAETLFTVLREYEESTYLEITPITGRTHQIRVHLSYIGHPIIADEIYGSKYSAKLAKKIGLKRQFLHAHRLEFTHPMTKLF